MIGPVLSLWKNIGMLRKLGFENYLVLHGVCKNNIASFIIMDEIS